MRVLVSRFGRGLLHSGLVALTLSACSDQLPTSALPPTPARAPHYVQYSSGFYLSNDGYTYFWDGQPPLGDLDQASIHDAKAGGMAPRFSTAGWVSGELWTNGDEYKIDLSYDLDHNGQPVYHNTPASTGWVSGANNFMNSLQDTRTDNFYEFKLTLGVNPSNALYRCAYSLTNGGSAAARKTFPFGISLSIIKPSIGIDFVGIHWGENSNVPLLAFDDPGQDCDELADPTCDLSETPEFEPCPAPGDPARVAPTYGWPGTYVTDVVGRYASSNQGGYLTGGTVCVAWVDWWTSWDGGHTWYYDYRQCTQEAAA